MAGWSYGEDSPTEGETPQAWSLFSDGSAGAIDFGTGEYGHSVFELGTDVYGPVHDIGSSAIRFIYIEQHRYGSGSGNVQIFFRCSDAPFNQDDIPGVGPAWELYPGYKVTRTFRYIQVRVKGGQGV